MAENKFSIELISGLTQKGTGQFPLVRAKDVDLDGRPITEYLAVALTQEEYDELLADGKVVTTTQYYIYEEESE